jgi:hypothetical protein
MGTNLVYFGHAKPLSNLIRYGTLKKLIDPKSVILMEEKFSSQYADIKNSVTITSTWADKDKNLFYDHQLLINFLNKKNKSLNIYLKNKLFGPFKIKSIRTLINSFRYLFNFLIKINWRIILSGRRQSTETLLYLLRLHNYLRADDRGAFSAILDQHKISKVIIFTTLSDPSIFDLVEACTIKKIQCILLPDCWDNISTAYSIPKNVSNIYVWSAQQFRDIQVFFPDLELKCEIIGTYRLDIQESKKFYNKKIKTISRNVIRILYLSGYHLESTKYTLDSIVKTLSDTGMNFKFDIEVIIRSYPYKKQTNGTSDQSIDLTLANYKYFSNIRYLVSRRNELVDDLMYADFVVSELSTAGLESAFYGLPVIFINSNRSSKRLTTNKAFEFSYSKDLYYFFTIANISSGKGKIVLKNSIRSLISSQKKLTNIDYLIEDVFKKLEFLGQPFDYKKWDKITSKLL